MPVESGGEASSPGTAPVVAKDHAVGAAVVLTSAAAVTGITVGVLVGLTGTNATVVTAVVSAVLTGIGGTVFGIAYLGRPSAHLIVQYATGSSIILFSIGLIAGVQFGLDRYNADRGFLSGNAARAHFAAYRMVVDEHHFLLETCSQRELSVNAKRSQLGLDPLPTDAFCPTRLPPIQAPLLQARSAITGPAEDGGSPSPQPKP